MQLQYLWRAPRDPGSLLEEDMFMTTTKGLTAVRVLSAGLVAWAALTVGPPRAQGATVYATTSDNNLVSFDSSSPGVINQSVAITGLAANETLAGIDFRPANGALYGVGSTNQLYTIDVSTGAATATGTGLGTSLAGTRFGVDFNPMVDRLRVVSDTGQNLRLNPDTGLLASTDPALNIGGVTETGIAGAAYINSFPKAASTILYDIDAETGTLYQQNPANSGTLIMPLSLGTGTINGEIGFDILGANTAFFSFTSGGVTGFYALDLGTGSNFLIGNVGGGSTITDFSLTPAPEPGTIALLAIGVAGLMAGRARFRRQ